jgi:hypothetical protein
MIEHTVRAFDSDLRALARKIEDMGSLTKQQIADASEAVMKRDLVLYSNPVPNLNKPYCNWVVSQFEV